MAHCDTRTPGLRGEVVRWLAAGRWIGYAARMQPPFDTGKPRVDVLSERTPRTGEVLCTGGATSRSWPMTPRSELVEKLERQGAMSVRAVLDESKLEILWSSIRPETAAGAVRGRSGDAYGARGLLTERPEIEAALAKMGIAALAARILGAAVFPIDATFFDKRADVNWAVPAHQDVVVPIPAGAPASAIRNARERHGIRYGEPADQVLKELVAVRVHFDDAGADNGGLAIVQGSHRGGRLTDAEVGAFPPEVFRPFDCRAGDVLLMKPLVVHRSGRSSLPARRRVLHVLYAPRGGWHARWGLRAAHVGR